MREHWSRKIERGREGEKKLIKKKKKVEMNQWLTVTAFRGKCERGEKKPRKRRGKEKRNIKGIF